MDSEIALTPGDEHTGKPAKRVNYGILNQDIYTVNDLATIFDVHTTTILAQIKTGKMRALYLGGPAGYRIHRDDVLNWVRRGEM